MTPTGATPRVCSVVGAGLTGGLLAVRLARAGHPVTLYDRRPDPRTEGGRGEGRSINLALSTRGLDALDSIGVGDAVRAEAVEMRGRMMHDRAGELTFQPYGVRADQVLRSVNRDELNRLLLDAADAEPLITARFDLTVDDVDLDAGQLVLGDGSRVESGVVFGADGAYSAVRGRLQRSGRFSYEQDYLEHGYKELTIPPGTDGRHRLDPGALHIWPRGAHMMIALPNIDGSFTCTLFWPFDGDGGFEEIDAPDEVIDTFSAQFPDVLAVMPDLVEEYLANPVGSLVTIRCSPWNLDDKALLIGDAAHAVVPFYGQGANAALEDCLLIMDELERHGDDWAGAFATFATARRPDTDALADLALDNFIEMRDHVASRLFLAHTALERTVHRRFPRLLVPLYTMVTFSRLPYREAVRRAHRQRVMLRVVVVLALLVLAALAITIIGALT